MIGLRVVAFDPFLFVNDKDTPLQHTMRAGEVVAERTDELGRALYDIRFDFRPDKISHGHFADRVQPITTSPYAAGCHCKLCRPKSTTSDGGGDDDR